MMHFICTFIIIAHCVASLQGMEKRAKTTDDARPYLSLKKYTHQVGGRKALYAYETVRNNQRTLKNYREALERFLQYETNSDRYAFFAAQSTQNKRAIINLSAMLTNITGSYWPYVCALKVALPEDLLMRIGSEVCSDGAIYDEIWTIGGQNWKLNPTKQTLAYPGGFPKGVTEEKTAMSHAYYKGLCYQLTHEEINAYARSRPSYDARFAPNINAAISGLLARLLYPGYIKLRNGNAITLDKVLYEFKYVSPEKQRIASPDNYFEGEDLPSFYAYAAKTKNLILYRDCVTNIAQIGPNRIGYCRREPIDERSPLASDYRYAAYILDLGSKPVETKLCTNTGYGRIGSLPYEHFVIMIEIDWNKYPYSYSLYGRTASSAPCGCAFTLYNKHGVAIQSIESGIRIEVLWAECKADEHGWDITDSRRRDYGERCTVRVQPVTYTYHKDTKPDTVDVFDFLLQESIKLGTTAPDGAFQTLLKLRKKSNTCSVS